MQQASGNLRGGKSVLSGAARTCADVDEHGFVARITRPSTAHILESTHTTENMNS